MEFFLVQGGEFELCSLSLSLSLSSNATTLNHLISSDCWAVRASRFGIYEHTSAEVVKSLTFSDLEQEFKDVFRASSRGASPSQR